MTAASAGNVLLVAETFGPTVQGEGPSTGQRAVFIRLLRCNLTCRTCDTPYTWDKTRFDLAAEGRPRSGADLLTWALDQGVELVVITGGEPLLQQRPLVSLVGALATAGRRVEIETNGTIAPLPALVKVVAQFNVSPKLARFGAGMAASRRIKPDVLRAFAATGTAVFKFVVTDPAELEEIDGLARLYGLAPVWVMPEGTDAIVVTTRLRALADPSVRRGYHLTTRLHLVLWGDQRGR
ncbi:MAG: 7-carboxy-7-deazaguanine synthase QueE [Pseudonocardiaceae bacterium]